MTWMKLTRPSCWNACSSPWSKGLFFTTFGLFYSLSPRTAHRMVGYLEEEAIISYTKFLEEIDSGTIENVPAPQIAIHYWNLAQMPDSGMLCWR